MAERSFAGFDDRMRLVQAVTNSTGEAFESLTKTAQRLGRETSFAGQLRGRYGDLGISIDRATNFISMATERFLAQKEQKML